MAHLQVDQKCLFSIKNCSDLQTVTAEYIKEHIFKALAIRQVAIFPSEHEIIVEAKAFDQLELIDLTFEDYKIEELGPNAVIDIENPADVQRFIKKIQQNMKASELTGLHEQKTSNLVLQEQDLQDESQKQIKLQQQDRENQQIEAAQRIRREKEELEERDRMEIERVARQTQLRKKEEEQRQKLQLERKIKEGQERRRQEEQRKRVQAENKSRQLQTQRKLLQQRKLKEAQLKARQEAQLKAKQQAERVKKAKEEEQRKRAIAEQKEKERLFKLKQEQQRRIRQQSRRQEIQRQERLRLQQIQKEQALQKQEIRLRLEQSSRKQQPVSQTLNVSADQLQKIIEQDNKKVPDILEGSIKRETSKEINLTAIHKQQQPIVKKVQVPEVRNQTVRKAVQHVIQQNRYSSPDSNLSLLQRISNSINQFKTNERYNGNNTGTRSGLPTTFVTLALIIWVYYIYSL